MASRLPPTSGMAGGGQLLVVSPHLDDAVFACGDTIAAHPGAIVVTIFAGGPSTWSEPTPWDRAAGFGPGEDAVACRREEDRRAIAALAGQPRWLSFWDVQYGVASTTDEIREAVDATIRDTRPGVVMIPLGLWHSDHRLAHESAWPLVEAHAGLRWLLYEDAIYRRFPDSGLPERLGALAALGVDLAPRFATCPASAWKRASIECYASQLRALGTGHGRGWEDALAPERGWAVCRR